MSNWCFFLCNLLIQLVTQTLYPMFNLLKWSVKTVLFLAGILPMLKCNSGYRDKEGKITFNGKEITDKNFVVLNNVFAKDSAHAYYKDAEIAGADLTSFVALDEQFAKDKTYVYFCEEHRESQTYYTTKRKKISTVENADPGTFELLGSGYAKDSAQAFFETNSFSVADIGSLKSIDRNFVKDDIRAYFNGKPVVGSDGKTFEVIESRYAKDRNNAYYYGYASEVKNNIYMLPCNVATFQVLSYPFAKDNTKVFYENEKINGANASTFRTLNHGFSKDKDAVFFYTKKITNADAASFEVFKENDLYTDGVYYAKDNNNIYWQDQKLQNCNLSTFTVLGQGYGADAMHVFYKTNLIKNANPKTFKVYPHGFGNADAEDSTNKFYEGLKTTEE